jgi:hypothetical protein
MEQKNNIDLFHVFENRNFNALELAKTILKNNIENELLVYALNKNQMLSNRAMWVLSHCADLDFERIKPFQVKLINHLKNKNIHSGVIRSVLRIFQEQPIPKKHESFMIDKCFEYIKNPKEAIAVRAFAMTVVYNISKPYPELLSELSIVLTHLNIEHESAGIINRAKNTLKNIAKLK